MLNVVAVLALSLQAPAGGGQTVNPSALISKMLAFYHDARTLTGTITMTQKVGEQSGSILTTVQFETPSKLYVRQQKQIGDRREWMIVSNGKLFAYDAPDLRTSETSKRLVEAQVIEEVKPTGVKEVIMRLGIREVYAAGAATLGDRSTPLDIAIGRTEDLRALRDQWATVNYKGTTEHGGKTVHVVMGDWRPYGNALPIGQYRMLVNDSGELLQFARSEPLAIAGKSETVLTTWDVRLERNGAPDPRLFAKIQ